MDFTSDWHSQHIPVWEQFLTPLDGQPIRCLEIGSHEGRSAVWIVKHLLSHRDSTLTCVDIWKSEDAERRFDGNITETGRADQVRKLKADSWRAFSLLSPGFDLIYIDGDHEGRHVLEDAIQSFRTLNAGGILIFDDYRNPSPSTSHPPAPAIDAFLQLWGDQLKVLHQEDQVFVRKMQ